MKLLRNLTAPFRGLLFNLFDITPKGSRSQVDILLQANREAMKTEPRQISQRGIDLIKHFEGCYLTAYKDPVGIWTIGYGHTGLTHQDGTVKAGRKITKEEAEELLRYDLKTFAARVETSTHVPLNDDEFAALVSFDFNTGGYVRSTLRRKLNAGDRGVAANEFLKWDKAGGKTLKGLTRRRQSERNLFLGHKDPIVTV